ncbi:MAG: hypothetical protein WBF33_16225 [Candidatus Nitrosopolaris sp.]
MSSSIDALIKFCVLLVGYIKNEKQLHINVQTYWNSPNPQEELNPALLRYDIPDNIPFFHNAQTFS